MSMSSSQPHIPIIPAHSPAYIHQGFVVGEENNPTAHHSCGASAESAVLLPRTSVGRPQGGGKGAERNGQKGLVAGPYSRLAEAHRGVQVCQRLSRVEAATSQADQVFVARGAIVRQTPEHRLFGTRAGITEREHSFLGDCGYPFSIHEGSAVACGQCFGGGSSVNRGMVHDPWLTGDFA